MIVEIFVFLLTTILVYFYYKYKQVHKHFDKLGVKYIPGIPVFGNSLLSTFVKRHIVFDLDAIYQAFPDEKYVGYIEGTQPILLIRDPEIIKYITVKDFEHFVNHKEFFSEDLDPLFGGSLLMMKGEKWRDMRTTLSPAFTGSKMRQMMPFMKEISDNVVEYLKVHHGAMIATMTATVARFLLENPKEIINVDDLIRRYTNDVIASTAFGVQSNSIKDKDNEFYNTGQNLFQFSAAQRFKIILAVEFPALSKKLGLTLFDKKTMNFFRTIVSDTISYRIKNNVSRPDMIQLLMEASRGTLKDTSNSENDNVGFATTQEMLKPREHSRKWTDDELAAQVFIFFAAGFESTASSLVLGLHELIVNPEVQEKLYQEIRTFKDTKGDLTYDNINDLKYMDCVLNETSRKWAAAIILDRVCNKEYTLPPPRDGANPVKLKPGDTVYNLVNSLQMDPKYYPEPEVFRPERFSDENKHNIKPFTYTPFGSGPRNCIGSRFAILEMKILLFYLVLNFKMVKCEKTVEEIKLKPTDFIIKADGGTFCRFEERK